MDRKTRIDQRANSCSFELMKPDPGTIDKERARLQAIIARPCPEKKPGARTRGWTMDLERAIAELRQLDTGAPPEEIPW